MIQRAAFRGGALAAALLGAFVLSAPKAQAMPPFAKSYGVKCSTCHTVVPGLNAYGRYVQRTGYASLNYDVLKRYTPFWFGEQVNGDSTGGVSDISPDHKMSFGNLALHGSGYIAPDWTFHAQQWLLQNDSGGGTLDTLWVTYNNLLHRDGHLFVGKIEAPGPSPFSQWTDVSAFTTPEITVGEHVYQLDGNRWGSKLAYVHGGFSAEVAWLLSSNGFLSSSDFDVVPGTEKSFQWKLTSAHADQPLEFGAYGSTGSFIVSTGALDRYTAIAGYVERDPQPHAIPGFFGIYQVGNDSNPGLDANGLQLPGARSQAFTTELYESMFDRSAILGYRYEYANDGLGTLIHPQNIDLAFNIPKYRWLHGYIEAGLGANSTAPSGGPTWRWFLWWTPPIQQ